MTGKDQALAIMAATIYAARTTCNSERRRLSTLRRDALKEAVQLFDEVMDREEEE